MSDLDSLDLEASGLCKMEIEVGEILYVKRDLYLMSFSLVYFSTLNSQIKDFIG